jgi:hypothetical protein
MGVLLHEIILMIILMIYVPRLMVKKYVNDMQVWAHDENYRKFACLVNGKNATNLLKFNYTNFVSKFLFI